MRLIAFITETAPFKRILTRIGEPPRPPPIAPARPGAAPSCFAWGPARTFLVRPVAADVDPSQALKVSTTRLASAAGLRDALTKAIATAVVLSLISTIFSPQGKREVSLWRYRDALKPPKPTARGASADSF